MEYLVANSSVVKGVTGLKCKRLLVQILLVSLFLIKWQVLVFSWVLDLQIRVTCTLLLIQIWVSILKLCKPTGMDPGHPRVHSCSPLMWGTLLREILPKFYYKLKYHEWSAIQRESSDLKTKVIGGLALEAMSSLILQCKLHENDRINKAEFYQP